MARGGPEPAKTFASVAIVVLLGIGASFGSLASLGDTHGNESLVSSSSSAPQAGTPHWANLSIPDSSSPQPRIDGNMVWDSTDGYGLLFGGQYLNSTTFRTVYYNDTWTYLGGHWTNVTVANSPPPRSGAVMADDPADHEVVLFGGTNSHDRYLNDTWTWAHGVWTNITPRSPAKSPPPGFWGSMTYDAATASVLLFGGINETSQHGNDTWSFKAGVWTQLAPTVLPTGRQGAGMTYDAASSEAVMFGGLGPLDYLNDTWTYSGGDWAPIAPGPHPGARVGPGLVYDSDQDVVVLYGGNPASFDYYSTWVFSGGSWTQYNLSLNPPNPTNPWWQMIYDPVDHYVFLFYEVNGEGPDMQSWALTFSTGPPALTVSLSASPDPLTLGSSTTLTATASGGTPPYTYVYSTPPPGCKGQDLSSVPCTPNATGTYVIGVNVTDSASNHAAAVTTLIVTSSSTGSSGSSGSSSWEWVIVVVVVVAALLIVFVVFRRRRKPPSPAAGVPPTSPPLPPPPAPPPP